MNNTEKLPVKRVLSNNLFILREAFKAAPLATSYLLMLDTLYRVTVFLEHTLQIVLIIDAIQYSKPFSNVIIIVAAMAAIVCARLTVDTVMLIRTIPKGKERIYRSFREKLYEKTASIDIACYDNPEFYNDFVFSMENVTTRIDSVLETAGRMLSGFTMILITGGYILLTDSLSIIFVVISFAVTYLLRTKCIKLRFKLEKALNPILRKSKYINRIFYLPDHAKEMRISDVKERLFEDYLETEKRVYKELKKKTRKIAILEFLRNYLVESFIFDFVYLLYLMFLTIVRNVISFGALFGLYRSTQTARGNIEALSDAFVEMHEHSLYIEKVRAFLNYDRKIVSAPNPERIGSETGAIELRDVGFSYQSGEGVKQTLSDINLLINPGEKTAIVGLNGAGKTTLVKLIMRLYDPCSGEVLYAGENIKNYDLKEYRNLFAVLFQDYQIYAASITQNILTSNDTPNDPRLKYVLKAAGIIKRIMKMKDKMNTQLTKEFAHGEVLSGGEKQKLAISRALYKESKIIILDEPSSALDPIAEYELNNTMLNISRDQTLIFISHRLSTTMKADRIYMFDSGLLVEAGSHNELLHNNGKYAEMFRLQSEKYR